MVSLQKLIRLLVMTSCLFIVGISNTQAEDMKSQDTYSSWGQGIQPGMGGYGGMGGVHPMFNPAMWMNPMTWMNPGNYMALMNPYLWMNPGSYMQMMNPMAYMNMMNPMMGMMGPMMNPMGMMGGMGSYGSNPMAQMPGGQMMDPKQYEDWYKQWTEMMKNMTPQPQANQ